MIETPKDELNGADREGGEREASGYDGRLAHVAEFVRLKRECDGVPAFYRFVSVGADIGTGRGTDAGRDTGTGASVWESNQDHVSSCD